MLRIVAMLSIVVGHVFYHGFHNECTDVLWLRPFTCCGVNIFVLISGYYGINFKLKSLFSLLFMVSFYTICSGIIEYFCWGNVFSLSRMSGVLLPFTGNHYYWFVTCYIYLYLLSPILNQGVLWLYDNCYLKKACVILLYVNFVGGWLLSNSLINKDGFNGLAKVVGQLKGQRQRSGVPPAFQRDNGLTGHIHRPRQIVLRQIVLSAKFPYPVIQWMLPPSIVKSALHFNDRRFSVKCQVHFTFFQHKTETADRRFPDRRKTASRAGICEKSLTFAPAWIILSR